MRGEERNRKRIVCFIDDSEFEHTLLREEVASAGGDLEFIQAVTFEEAVKALETRRPSLFLLDLWGRDEEVKNPSITPKEEVKRAVARIPALDSVYEGLGDVRGDVPNEYLKRMFAIVDGWRSLFERVCGRMGQNRKYGLRNLEQVRIRYPGIPAVFYTRKSLIGDAVALFRAGADGLYIKPTGTDDDQTRQLTRDFAPLLIRELRRLMDRPSRGDMGRSA